jgi:hypothetical protein
VKKQGKAAAAAAAAACGHIGSNAALAFIRLHFSIYFKS